MSQPELRVVAKVLKERDSVRFDAVRLCPRPPPNPANPIVISVLKDENLRLPAFLRHYREAGVERFAIIDNGSTDGGFEYLLAQPDVDLYRKEGPFHWVPKQGWINRLVAHYGYRRWYLYADADELVVFDGLGERTFADLAGLMERRGFMRVRGFLVDMYADGPVLGSRYSRGENLVAACPYFDPDGYEENRFRELMSVKGGPRMRVFGRAAAKFRPELTKYPMFFLDHGECVASPHYIWPLSENFASPRLVGVLHFKFLPDLSERIREAIARKSYWSDSLEYRCYLEIIDADPEVSLHDARSARYSSPHDLVSRGLVESIDWPKAQSLTRRANLAMRRAQARLRDAATTLAPLAAVSPGDAGSGATPRAETAPVEIDAGDFVGFLP